MSTRRNNMRSAAALAAALLLAILVLAGTGDDSRTPRSERPRPSADVVAEDPPSVDPGVEEPSELAAPDPLPEHELVCLPLKERLLLGDTQLLRELIDLVRCGRDEPGMRTAIEFSCAPESLDVLLDVVSAPDHDLDLRCLAARAVARNCGSKGVRALLDLARRAEDERDLQVAVDGILASDAAAALDPLDAAVRDLEMPQAARQAALLAIAGGTDARTKAAVVRMEDDLEDEGLRSIARVATQRGGPSE